MTADVQVGVSRIMREVSGASPLRECYLQNLRIISEKNLTLQWLVFAVVLFLAFEIDDLEIFLHQLFSFLH